MSQQLPDNVMAAVLLHCDPSVLRKMVNIDKQSKRIMNNSFFQHQYHKTLKYKNCIRAVFYANHLRLLPDVCYYIKQFI